MTDRRCEEIQNILAGAGATALQADEEAQQHLVDCDACYRVLEALQRLDEALVALPPIDAPDDTVARTLAAVREDAERDPVGSSAASVVALGPVREARRWMRRHARAVASVAAAAGVAVLFSTQLFNQAARDSWTEMAPPDDGALREGFSQRDMLQRRGSLAADSPGGYAGAPLAEPEEPSAQAPPLPESSLFDANERGMRLPAAAQVRAPAKGQAGASSTASDADGIMPASLERGYGRFPARTDALNELKENVSPDVRSQPWSGKDGALGDAEYRRQVKNEPAPLLAARPNEPGFGDLSKSVDDRKQDVGAKRKQRLSKTAYEAAGGLAERSREVAQEEAELSSLEAKKLRALGYLSDGASSLDGLQSGRAELQGAGVASDSDGRLAEFDRGLRALENVSIQEPSGYWANTYVPGDPAVRWLEARLLEQGTASLAAFGESPIVLEQAARPPLQPFDRPTDAALDVYLSSDRAALDGRGRAILQVGIQATERHSGGRPAMNLGVVLDTTGDLPRETQAAMRAVLESFSKARDDGDHFSLTLSGRPGGARVAGDDFRHGPLSIALDEAFEREDATSRTAPLSLVDAVAAAAAETLRGANGSALGASAVVVVTDRPFGREFEELVELAHRSAVDGVFVSVVAIGDGVSARQVESVALAGQGHRYLLGEPAEAEGIVLRELQALSRVVARAVRLRIRLAPGVELVDVLGSERLDAASADRVREAERSVDTRLARELGIEADRGEDEDGIQIVIPAFYAGDSHVVLLDVIAPGPGPIADVTARFKDVAMRRNGTARASFALSGSERAAGPLQHNVLENLLAHRLALVLERAGGLVLSGQEATAISEIEDFRALLSALRGAGRLDADASLGRDIAMLGEYLDVMRAGALTDEVAKRHLADSLRIAGHRKTQVRSAR